MNLLDPPKIVFALLKAVLVAVWPWGNAVSKIILWGALNLITMIIDFIIMILNRLLWGFLLGAGILAAFTGWEWAAPWLPNKALDLLLWITG